MRDLIDMIPDDFTVRLDILGLALLPLAMWYSPMSAWYDVADFLLAGVVYGFILLTFGSGVFGVWVLSNPDTKFKITTDPVGTDNTSITLCVLVYIGWSIALLQHDLGTAWLLFTIGCSLFPLIASNVMQKAEAARTEKQDRENERAHNLLLVQLAEERERQEREDAAQEVAEKIRAQQEQYELNKDPRKDD